MTIRGGGGVPITTTGGGGTGKKKGSGKNRLSWAKLSFTKPPVANTKIPSTNKQTR